MPKPKKILPMDNKQNILNEIISERERQDKKWGVQNHPSVDSGLSQRDPYPSDRMCEEYEIPSEARAKQLCEINAKIGLITWAHIAIEEVSEVVAAKDEITRREELVQLGAVILAWIESIDRNS